MIPVVEARLTRVPGPCCSLLRGEVSERYTYEGQVLRYEGYINEEKGAGWLMWMILEVLII